MMILPFSKAGLTLLELLKKVFGVVFSAVSNGQLCRE